MGSSLHINLAARGETDGYVMMNHNGRDKCSDMYNRRETKKAEFSFRISVRKFGLGQTYISFSTFASSSPGASIPKKNEEKEDDFLSNLRLRQFEASGGSILVKNGHWKMNFERSAEIAKNPEIIEVFRLWAIL